MKKEKLYELSELFTEEHDVFAENLRHNVDICLKYSDLTLRDLAEKADISFDTLKNLLYQNSKDCKLSTAAMLAKAIGVTLDELIGLQTLTDEDKDCISMFRQMPDHYQYFVRWFIHRQYELSQKKFRQSAKEVPVVELSERTDGSLRILDASETVDITNVPTNIKPQIFTALKLNVAHYMPIYHPDDILLIANDRYPKQTEHSVIIYGNNVFVANRSAFPNANGDYEYHSVRDGKFRCLESDVDDILGYIAYVLPDS